MTEETKTPCVSHPQQDISWIGEIPEGWKISPVKYHFNKRKEISGKDNEKYERLSLTLNGVQKREKWEGSGLQPKDFNTYQLLRKDDLVFKLIDLENISTSRVGLSHDTGLVSPAYIILHAKNTVMPSFAEKYFLMLWNQNIFNALGNCSVRSSLSTSDLMNIPFVLPPLSEQRLIADFLDSKCSEIDALAGNLKERKENLKKYRKAVITEAVTKGLDKDMKMRDSGIEWIGEIPEGWSISRFKYVSTVKSNLVQPDKYMDFHQVAPDNIEKDSGHLLSYQSVEESGIVSGNHLFHRGQILYCEPLGN